MVNWRSRQRWPMDGRIRLTFLKAAYAGLEKKVGEKNLERNGEYPFF